jgi:hypothetical protein
VARVSRTIGDSRRSSSVVISIRNNGTKNRARYKAGSGGIAGYVLAITMRSNGSSKIIGAAIAPMAPLSSLVLKRSLVPKPAGPREMTVMTTKTTTTAEKVIGAMGSLGAAEGALREYS